MFGSRFPEFLLRLFAPHRPVDYVIKPAATWATFLVLYLAWEVVFVGWMPQDLIGRLMAVSLTQLPFMGIAFVLLIYLDRLQSGLVGLAMTDALTGLPNRRAFFDQVTRFQRRGDQGYLLIIDADHFKRINDTYGHAVGDTCLQAIANRLKGLETTGNLVARIGGEEFGAYLAYSTRENLIKTGKRICQEILVRRADQPQPLRLTLSVGASETRPKEPIETALARADEALYFAKNAGRARLVLWTKSISKAA